MAEEETEYFPPFREAVDDEQREALGMQWLAFHDEHEQAEGLSGEDAEVAEVIDTEVPEGDPSL
ncbi:hypothetical protein ACI79P_14805 [Blastococcus sp. SYSU DS0510]